MFIFTSIFNFLKPKLTTILAYLAAFVAFMALYKTAHTLKSKNQELEHEINARKQQNALLQRNLQVQQQVQTDINQLDDVAVLKRLHSDFQRKR